MSSQDSSQQEAIECGKQEARKERNAMLKAFKLAGSCPLLDYFRAFGILKTCGRNFWLTNCIQFFDGLAYFTLINIFTLYLGKYCGFSDANAVYWVGLYTLFISLFAFACGTVCDIIGLRKTYTIGFLVLICGRIFLGTGTDIGKMIGLGLADSRFFVMAGIGIMAFGSAFMSPCITTSIRRFSPKAARPTGFNFYYLFMNIGAMLAGFAIVDPLRECAGDVNGCWWVVNLGTCCSVIGFIFTRFVQEDFYADEDEKRLAEEKKNNPEQAPTSPLKLIAEVSRETAFRRLLIFLLLTLGVRLVFTLQFMVMPQYYTRTVGDDFKLGIMESLNPIVIVVGLIAIIPILNKFSTVKLMIVGMSISAASLILMAIPAEWYMVLPGVTTVAQGYFIAIVFQILIFAFGELLFSPRFSEYTARVAPHDKVASYMSLSALPMFIAKPINGVIGGLLVSYMCYDGIAAKMDVGCVPFWGSPEAMWFIYLVLAVISPLAIIWTKDRFVSEDPESDSK